MVFYKYSLLGIAALSFTSCDSSSTSSQARSENLDAIADPPTILKTGDNIFFTQATGSDKFTRLIFTSNTNGNLAKGNEYVTNPENDDTANRVVLPISFQYNTGRQNTFHLNFARSNQYAAQFRDHLQKIYGGTRSSGNTLAYGLDSLTRAIVLGHNGNFSNAELQTIADEFNGVIQNTTGKSIDDYAPLLHLHPPTKTLYLIDYQTFDFGITSNNQSRLAGRIFGNYTVSTHARIIRWRRPTAAEIGDRSTWRLEPNHLVPYISNETVNLGTQSTGTYEFEFLVNTSL